MSTGFAATADSQEPFLYSACGTASRERGTCVSQDRVDHTAPRIYRGRVDARILEAGHITHA